MLSRTADSLFWIARYVERAENMARLIDMGRRMSATPCERRIRYDEWPSILQAAGCADGFFAKTKVCAQRDAMAFLIVDRSNPSSVVSCVEAARANARSARTALTVEMWEALNEAWIEFRGLGSSDINNGSMGPLLDRVKDYGARFRGAADSTMLHNDGYDFLRVGLFIERMDNAARLLDVKYFSAQNRSDDEAAADQYEWVSLLRAAGVLRAYQSAYRSDYEPEKIIDFLVLNTECPRALAHCASQVAAHLGALARRYGASHDCHMIARMICSRMLETGIDDISGAAGDLHGFLTDAIRRNNALSLSIARSYHFAPAPQAAPAAPEPQARETAPATVRSSMGQRNVQGARQSDQVSAV